MYSVRANLLQKIIKETDDLQVDIVKVVFGSKMKDLGGMLCSCDLPSIECSDLLFKRRMRKTLSRLKELKMFFSGAKYPKDLIVSQIKFLNFAYPEIVEYCEFYYGDRDVLLSSVIPLFVIHLSRIVTNLESNLVGLREDYRIDKIDKDFCYKLKNYSGYLGEDLTLSGLLTLLDSKEQRNLIHHLGVFVSKKYKDYDNVDLVVINDFINTKISKFEKI